MMKKSILLLIAGMISIFVLGTIPAAACVASYDYGDAPDSYSTLSSSDGARHWISSLYLGAGVDTEGDGLPSALADADVDDGVLFTNIWVQGSLAHMDVTSSGTGFLNAWVAKSAISEPLTAWLNILSLSAVFSRYLKGS